MDTLLQQFASLVAMSVQADLNKEEDPLWMRILLPFDEEDAKSPFYWVFMATCFFLVVYTMNGGFDDTLEPLFRSLGLIGN